MKNKKLIALLLIAAMVLGGVVGVAAAIDLNNPDTDLGNNMNPDGLCVCCFGETLVPEDFLGMMRVFFSLPLDGNMGVQFGRPDEAAEDDEFYKMAPIALPEGEMTWNEFFAAFLDGVCYKGSISEIDNTVVFTANAPAETKTVRELYQQIQSFSDDKFAIVFFADKDTTFPPCKDCPTCLARECNCCLDINELFGCLRSWLARLFTLFNYLNVGRIEFMD